MNIFIAGQKRFGWAVLEMCQSLGFNITGVAAPLPKNGEEDRLHKRARVFDLPIIPAGTLNAHTLPANTDLIIAAHSHDFIGKKTRQKAKLGAIGYHPSLLPLHRGRSAIEWPLRMNERVTGGSVFWLNDVVDGGPVAAQDYVFIRPGDTASELWHRDLFPLGLKLLGQTLNDVSKGVLVRIPQEAALATWEPAIEQPALYRPDLPELGDGGFSGYTVVTERSRVDEARNAPELTPEDDEYWLAASHVAPRGFKL